MTAIIDYGSGNLFSLGAALERIGERYIITNDDSLILSSDRIILPGVGEASGLINNINKRGIDKILKRSFVPVLGICIGLQLMCTHSDEGDVDCLGFFPVRVKRIKAEKLKIPHMGWNKAVNIKGPLFNGIREGEWFYFVHSFAPEISSETSSVTDYGGLITSSLSHGRFYGTQFHPEKSGEAGEMLLRNFINMN